MLVGTMLQMSTQMGLHCAFGAQDFAKVPLKLDTSEHSEWVQTWEACNIVATRLVLTLNSFPVSIQ
jgi:hypothetical protein